MTQLSEPPAYPKPRRWVRWFKWIIITGIMLLFALIVAHGVWSYNAHRNFDARLEALKAAGEPMTLDALRPQINIPDEDNAAVWFVRASDAIDPGFIEWIDSREVELGLPLREEEIKALRKWRATSKEVLDLTAKATTKRAVYWNIQPVTPIIFADLPYLGKTRHLANTLAELSLLAHHEGDDAAALTHVAELESLAGALGTQTSLIQFLVSSGVRGLGVHVLEEILPDLSDDDKDVSRGQLRGLIDILLKEDSAKQAVKDAFRFERFGIADSILLMIGGGLAPPAPPAADFGPIKTISSNRAFIIKPFFINDASTALDDATGMIASIEESSWPRCTASMPTPPSEDSWGARFSVYRILVPSFERAIQAHFRILADRRMAATAIAIRLYGFDHDGQLPKSLQDLVPDHLPAVPLDPFSADDSPLKYNPDPADPILYSVDEDGQDDGGSRERPASRYGYSSSRPLSRWQTQDAVFSLSRQPRPEPEIDEDAEPLED